MCVAVCLGNRDSDQNLQKKNPVCGIIQELNPALNIEILHNNNTTVAAQYLYGQYFNGTLSNIHLKTGFT